MVQEAIDSCLEVGFIWLKWRLLVAQRQGARLTGREQERQHNTRLVQLLLRLVLRTVHRPSLIGLAQGFCFERGLFGVKLAGLLLWRSARKKIFRGAFR